MIRSSSVVVELKKSRLVRDGVVAIQLAGAVEERDESVGYKVELECIAI